MNTIVRFDGRCVACTEYYAVISPFGSVGMLHSYGFCSSCMQRLEKSPIYPTINNELQATRQKVEALIRQFAAEK